MLFEIERTANGFAVSPRKLTLQPVADLGLLEKDIEHWIADHPQLLLPGEAVLVIGQSIAGRAMADVLALDQFGRLLIVEIKRQRTGRETIAQLLGYAARLRNVTYEELNAIAQSYSKWTAGELLDAFTSELSDSASISKEQLGRKQRVLIVAPESDEDLRDIVDWLRSYGVPIEFVPFAVYADETLTPRYLQIEGVHTQEAPDETTSHELWIDHWIFNTNEKYAPGAYHRMFERGVAAIYGYPNGGRNLEGASAGQKVFAYVNRQGLRALGTVRDGVVRAGEGIFVDESGNQLPDEYHLGVEWNFVVSEALAISSREAVQFGYNLPVRSVFGKLRFGQTALKLEIELKKRTQNRA